MYNVDDDDGDDYDDDSDDNDDEDVNAGGDYWAIWQMFLVPPASPQL